MKLAIFGGSGKTGQEIINQALKQGHSLKALVRNPEKIKIKNANLEIIQGDALNNADVEKTIEGTDVVLVALGSWQNKQICSQATERIISAMQKLGVKRIVVESANGIAETHHGFRIWVAWLFLGKIMADKERMEALLEQSNLDWVSIRPVGLTNGPLTQKYALNSKTPSYTISRADVSDCMLKQVQGNELLKKKVTISKS